jgi:hypothetical protein
MPFSAPSLAAFFADFELSPLHFRHFAFRSPPIAAAFRDVVSRQLLMPAFADYCRAFAANATLRFHIADAGFFHAAAAARQLTPADAYYATDAAAIRRLSPCRHADTQPVSYVRFRFRWRISAERRFSAPLRLIFRYFSSDAAAMPVTAPCRRRRRFSSILPIAAADAAFILPPFSFADSFRRFRRRRYCRHDAAIFAIMPIFARCFG